MQNVKLSKNLSLFYLGEKQVRENITSRGFSTDKSTEDLERSDLTHHVYEGGFKVWECSVDLCAYLLKTVPDLNNQHVLELGCGAGLLGILAAKLGAGHVVFQDFNESVLQCFTSDNIKSNNLNPENYLFISGGWSELAEKLAANSFDLVLTSETIYNEGDYEALHDVIYRSLSNTGVCLLAAKFFYFGLSGCVPSFIQFIKSKNLLSIKEVVAIDSSVPRKILSLQKL